MMKLMLKTESSRITPPRSSIEFMTKCSNVYAAKLSNLAWKGTLNLDGTVTKID